LRLAWQVASLEHAVIFQRDAMNATRSRAVVSKRVVLHVPVVPDGDVTLLPLKASLHFRRLDEVVQEIQQALAGGLGDTEQMTGVRLVDEDQLAAGFRMRLDDRYLDRWKLDAGVLDTGQSLFNGLLSACRIAREKV
jgi:hypothetical protein